MVPHPQKLNAKDTVMGSRPVVMALVRG